MKYLNIKLIAFCLLLSGLLSSCGQGASDANGKAGSAAALPASTEFDLVILNGRVMDPETNFDAVSNVGVKDGKIAIITEKEINGKRTIDASGHVVSPGFIDGHVHVVDSPFGQKQALRDGLTTTLVPIAGGFNQCTAEDMLRYAMLYTPSWNVVSDTQVVTDKMIERLQTLGKPSAFKGCDEERTSKVYFGVKAYTNSNQWDHVFEDGGMFKHGNMGQGIYVDPARDFCGMTYALSPNDRAEDHSPGYLRAAAKALHGS